MLTKEQINQKLQAGGYQGLTAPAGYAGTDPRPEPTTDLDAQARVIITRLQSSGGEPSGQERDILDQWKLMRAAAKGESDTQQSKYRTKAFVQGKQVDNGNQKFADEISQLGPIADVRLQDGETVLSKYLQSRYGADNVKTYPNGKYLVRDSDSGKWQPLPRGVIKNGVLPALGSLVSNIGGTAAGEAAGGAIGALGGPAAPVTVPLGATVGAGLGAAAGERISLEGPRKVAASFLSPEDLKHVENEINGRSTGAGVLGGAFGGVGKVAGAYGKAFELAKDAGEKGIGSTLKRIPQAARLATKNLTQDAVNQLRIKGNTGKEISSMKGQVEAQGIMENLLNETKGYQPGQAGKVAQVAVQKAQQSLQSKVNATFNGADRLIQKKALGNQKVDFLDATDFWNKLNAQIGKVSNEGLTAEQLAQKTQLLDAVQSGLNLTRREVAEQVTQNTPEALATKARFRVIKKETAPILNQITGQTEILPTGKTIANEAFNPQVVTARDIRAAYNAVGDILNTAGDSSSILNTASGKQFKGVLTAARNELGQTLGTKSAVNVTGKTTGGMKSGLLGTIKTKGATGDLAKYRNGYQAASSKFGDLPQEIVDKIGSTDPAINPTMIEGELFKLDPTHAKQVREMVQTYAPNDFPTFEAGVKHDLFTKSPRSAQPKIDLAKLTSQGARNAVARNEEEVAANIVNKGERPSLANIKKATYDVSEQPSANDVQLPFGTIHNALNKSELNQVHSSLLSPQSLKDLKAQVARGANAQTAAGKPASGFDTLGVIAGQSLAPKVTGKIDGGGMLSAVTNIPQRFAADALEGGKYIAPGVNIAKLLGAATNSDTPSAKDFAYSDGSDYVPEESRSPELQQMNQEYLDQRSRAGAPEGDAALNNQASVLKMLPASFLRSLLGGR